MFTARLNLCLCQPGPCCHPGLFFACWLPSPPVFSSAIWGFIVRWAFGLFVSVLFPCFFPLWTVAGTLSLVSYFLHMVDEFISFWLFSLFLLWAITLYSTTFRTGKDSFWLDSCTCIFIQLTNHDRWLNLTHWCSRDPANAWRGATVPVARGPAATTRPSNLSCSWDVSATLYSASTTAPDPYLNRQSGFRSIMPCSQSVTEEILEL